MVLKAVVDTKEIIKILNIIKKLKDISGMKVAMIGKQNIIRFRGLTDDHARTIFVDYPVTMDTDLNLYSYADVKALKKLVNTSRFKKSRTIFSMEPDINDMKKAEGLIIEDYNHIIRRVMPNLGTPKIEPNGTINFSPNIIEINDYSNKLTVTKRTLKEIFEIVGIEDRIRFTMDAEGVRITPYYNSGSCQYTISDVEDGDVVKDYLYDEHQNIVECVMPVSEMLSMIRSMPSPSSEWNIWMKSDFDYPVVIQGVNIRKEDDKWTLLVSQPIDADRK